MNAKKWAVSLVSITLVVVLIFGAITFIIDPLLQYREEPDMLTYRHYSELYCNPGIAKNYKYNAVFLGSSMVENANVAEIDSLFHCKTIKVPYSGASSYNHRTILDVCYKSGNKVDKVFWALDEYALTTDKDAPRYPLPDYLYDYNKANDLSYLLNLDIFYFYTVKDVVGTLAGKNQTMMRDGSWMEDESVYCKENALSTLTYPMKQQENKGEKYFIDNLTDNLTYNIIPFVKEHPETEFYFYMVPYSITYWYMNKQEGKLDAEIYNARFAVGELLKYDNVKVYFFQNDIDIITDLSNYKDHTHFKPSINSYMTNQMAEDGYRITKETYEKVFDNFYDYLTNFDYDTFYKNNIK